MISNEEIERYKQFALTKYASGTPRSSIDEQNLARMVVNLVEVIDYLSNVAISQEGTTTLLATQRKGREVVA